jgi:hypothetical protein
VACATCHDHKFDPIPTKDYYSLQGIFTNTELHETPLAPEDVVKVWQDEKKQLDKKRDELKKFNESQTAQLGEILASNTARYMLASRGLASADGLDPETLTRWKKYLEAPKKDHPFLKEWADLVARKADAKAFESAAQKFQDLVLVVNDEKKSIDDKNHISLGIDPSREKMASASLLSLDRDKFVLWRNLFDKNSKDAGGFVASGEGVYYYGGTKIDRFLSGEWKTHLETLRKDVERLEKALPPQYPFLQTVADKKDCKDGHIYIRGDASNKGEIAPRRFLQILSEGERKHFTKGSGRLELAEAIADPKNPLTARVMVNRIWQNHFGRGIVATPSNFGQLGERPTHPELLDYLASQFVAQKWSMKAMHRMIMLSSTYALAAESDPKNVTVDADNRLLWRANRKRMDAETLRDSVLFVAGDLDLSTGGKAEKLDENNRRRTVYGFVSRRKLDGMLALFDFPNPNSTSEQRMSTNVPPQRLFLMNSPFIETEAENLAKKLPDGPVERKIASAYEKVLSREPLPEELKLAEEFLKDASWKQYARVLLSANEFGFID